MFSNKRVLKYFVISTTLLLLYVHEQTSILRLSYSIEKKERELARLSEEYKVTRYQLARLHSPGFLSRQLKERSLNLTTPKVIEVIKVQMPKTSTSPVRANVPQQSTLLSWIGSLKEAQAKTSK
jgi:hypothetical protein